MKAVQISVSPELSVRRGREAIEFYKAAFGAAEIHRVGGTEENEEVVAQLSLGNASFWVSDESPPNKNFSPESLGGTTVRLLLIVQDPHSVVERAVGLGASEVSPLQEEHGWLLGRIEDPFGHSWEIGKPLVEWPPSQCSSDAVWQAPVMAPESELEPTQHGLVPKGDGWFVLNACEARWRHSEERGAVCVFEGEPEFSQLGINLFLLGPGEPMAMYHWEADQEDFLVLAGEALLIVEGEERPLRRWDLVHCPAGTKHVIVGAGAGPCVVLAVGARERSTGPDWGEYTVDEAALRHGAGVEQETTDPKQAYGRVTRREPTAYREGWLP